MDLRMFLKPGDIITTDVGTHEEIIAVYPERVETRDVFYTANTFTLFKRKEETIIENLEYRIRALESDFESFLYGLDGRE